MMSTLLIIMESLPPAFLENWTIVLRGLSFVCACLGVLMILVYFFRKMLIREPKDKYDFINAQEIKMMYRGSFLLVLAVTLILNTLSIGNTTFFDDTVLIFFLARFFLTVFFFTVSIVIIQNILKYYYPFYIETRLKSLRYKSRISPEGREMKLLSEDEEDVYLDEGMQAEENVFSMDYDVWIDPKSDYVKIEKYNGKLHALVCPSCSYQTLKLSEEEIISTPKEAGEEGEMIKKYKCDFCNHTESRSIFYKSDVEK